MLYIYIYIPVHFNRMPIYCMQMYASLIWYKNECRIHRNEVKENTVYIIYMTNI